jgi:hypothetical protein
LYRNTATDSSGSSSTGTFKVTIVDTMAPVVMAPADVTVEATGLQTAVAIGTATATDAVNVVNLSSDAPATYPMDTTVVTWTATDAAGNVGRATQNVTVMDTTPPATTVPGNLTVEASDVLTTVALGTASATDLVDGVVAVINDAPAAGFPLGITTVTWTAEDASGNVSTASQTVTVGYRNSGFLIPLRVGGIYKQGRTIPVKFQLFYADGTTVTNAVANISVFQTSSGEVVGEPIEVSSVSNADIGTTFRTTGDQYIYNLGTKNFIKGTYRIIAAISDGSAITIEIALK